MRDMMGMMGKIKELQANMERMQQELETLEVTGSAGGGLVSVTMSAKGAVRKVSIDASLMKADEKEIVED
jgi:DNA-binding YbaB/EbfC family protein